MVCYAGSRGEETPRRFYYAGNWIEDGEILDRWLVPDHRYFRLRDAAWTTYLLRHDSNSRRWELCQLLSAGRTDDPVVE